ncbi:MAG: type II toxin-antitoxin system RatA family toxin [Pseudomonadota bacterium]
MTTRRTKTVVPYSPAQMYDLVADIEKYPVFLPWCLGLRVVERDLENGEGILLADMIVAYKVFRERFRSKVFLDPRAHTIDAHYTHGPFERLQTRWHFSEIEGGGTQIDFFIDFAFRNAVLQTTARMVFEKAFARMTEAFIARADDLYRVEQTAVTQD